jgi:hypothetical protein
VTVRHSLALGVLILWVLVSVVRLSRLVEPAAEPPGAAIAPTFAFFRTQIPMDAGYLYVLPGEFGQDTGDGPRLRYELYPRLYDDIRASTSEADVRALMQREGLTYIIVPDADQYAPTHWLRQPHDWLRRTDLNDNTYLLEVSS